MHHDFQNEVLRGLKRKTIDSQGSQQTGEFEPVVKMVKKNKHCRASKAKWTSEEDEALTRAVVQNGEGNWKKIAQVLNDRSHLQCLHRWQKVLNPALVKGPWKEEEDNKLVELVEKFGAKDWSSIASHIPGRIGKQCRERWFNHLSPEVRKTNWSPEEDRIIVEAHHRLGNKWTAISKLLDGRPANAIKNHWNSTLLKRIQDETGESPVRRERKKPKIVGAVQATDDSDSSSISSCSSPEESPRYSNPSTFAPLPIPPQPQYIATPSFLPQAVSEAQPSFASVQLVASPRYISSASLLNSFAAFGDGGHHSIQVPVPTWDWPASQHHATSIGMMHPVASMQGASSNGVYVDHHQQLQTPIVATDTYSFPVVPHPELSYCLDQQASDIHSSADGVAAESDIHHSNMGFYNCGEMEMPSLFTM